MAEKNALVRRGITDGPQTFEPTARTDPRRTLNALFAPQIAFDWLIDPLLPVGRTEDGSYVQAMPEVLHNALAAAGRLQDNAARSRADPSLMDDPAMTYDSAGAAMELGGLTTMGGYMSPKPRGSIGQAGGGGPGWFERRRMAKEDAERQKYYESPEGKAETARIKAMNDENASMRQQLDSIGHEYDKRGHNNAYTEQQYLKEQLQKAQKNKSLADENKSIHKQLLDMGYTYEIKKGMGVDQENSALKKALDTVKSEMQSAMDRADKATKALQAQGFAGLNVPHPNATTVPQIKANADYLDDILQKRSEALPTSGRAAPRKDAAEIAKYLPSRTAQEVSAEQMESLRKPIANVGRTASGMPAVGRGHVRPVDRLLAAMDRMEAEQRRLALSVPGRKGGLSHPEQMALVERYFAQGGKVPEIAGKPWGATDVDLIREIVRLQSDKELMGGATRGGGSLPPPPQASAAPLARPGAQNALPPSAAPAASLPGPQPALPAASSAPPAATNALSQSASALPNPQMPSLTVPNMDPLTIPKMDPFRLPDKSGKLPAIVAGAAGGGAAYGSFDEALAGFQQAMIDLDGDGIPDAVAPDNLLLGRRY